jgi:hypothetical protein
MESETWLKESELDFLERKTKMKMENLVSIPYANIYQFRASKDYKPKSPNSKSEEKYINHIHTFLHFILINYTIYTHFGLPTFFSKCSIIYQKIYTNRN